MHHLFSECGYNTASRYFSTYKPLLVKKLEKFAHLFNLDINKGPRQVSTSGHPLVPYFLLKSAGKWAEESLALFAVSVKTFAGLQAAGGNTSFLSLRIP